jgi:hypothetical protein
MRFINCLEWTRRCQRSAFLSLVMVLSIVIFLSPASALGQSAEHNAIFLHEDITYEIKGNNEAELHERGKIKILRESGSDWGEIVLTESSFIELKEFSGKVYDASGRLIYEYSKDDGHRFCGFSGYALYRDICTHDYILSTSSYPFTIEYEYREKHKSLFFWPEWNPRKSIPVEESRYTLIAPADFGFNTKTIGEAVEPVVTEEGNNRVYTWEMKDVPATKDEECTAPYQDENSRLLFSPKVYRLDKYDFSGGSWSELGRDYHNMVSDRFDLNGEQKDLLGRLHSYSMPVRDICDSLHQYLQRRTRYVAVEVGVGGWLPSKAKDTFERGYGDCKDLSTMYVAMLRYLGIQSGLALILTKNLGVTYPDFPTLNRFNHVIMYSLIDGDTVWTDPTCEYCRFGDLPYPDENAYVLAFDEYVSRLVLTPSSTPSENVIRRTALVKTASKRDIGIELRIAATGDAGQLIEAALRGLKRHEWERIFKNDLFGVSDKFSVDSIVTGDRALWQEEVVATLYGEVSNAVHSIGSKQIFDITFLSCLTKPERIDLTDRAQHIDLNFPRRYIDSVIVVAPKGYQIPELPPDTSVSGPFVEFNVTSGIDGNRVIIAHNKQIKTCEIKLAELIQFQAAVDREKECIPTHIMLVKE